MTDQLISELVIFVLAVLVGIEVIKKVPSMLHTPLMSGSNAISGIAVLGAMVAAGSEVSWLAQVLGFTAIVFAMTNAVGGFLVTNRMLKMFRRDETKEKR